MNHLDNKRQGFTLIELMLAMTFISILLIAIALTILQIINIYNHGITIKQVDQAGQVLSTDIEQSVNASAPFTVSGTNSRFISTAWGGRLCMGNYSYVWNYGSVLQVGVSPTPTRNLYKGESATLTSTSTPIRFVKVVDGGGSYCTTPNANTPLPDIDPANAVELLNASDGDLVVHSFSITSSDPTAFDATTGERLYNITFVLGTNDPAALNADGTACLAPSIGGSDVSYCSVEEFNIVALAGNAVE